MNVDDSPLGNSSKDAAEFVRTEIERSLPEGWCVTGLERPDYLNGDIQRIEDVGPSASGGYRVIIPAGLDLLVFTYGNGGPGADPPSTSLALVVPPILLRMFGMATCIERLLALPMNTYYLT